MQFGSRDRMKLRMACRIRVGDRHHSGVVLNVSPGGLFVQTNAKPPAGGRVEVALSLPGSSSNMALEAAVAWKRVVPPRLVSVAQGGVGLKLLNPPEGYYQFLAEAARTLRPEVAPDSAPKPAQAAPPDPPEPSTPPSEAAPAEVCAYSVRVSRGPRSRTVTVRADSHTEAASEALRVVGPGWKVIDARIRESA